MQPTVLCTLLSMNRHVVCTMIPVIEVAVKKLIVNAHCKGTHHVHAKVTHLWGLCARTQSGVLTRGGREA